MQGSFKVLSENGALIIHPATRNRGTIGGNIFPW